MAATVVVRSTPAPDALPERAEIHRDGDLVVYAAKAAGTSAPSAIGNGYATYGDVTLLEHYDVRLVESPGVERLRPHLDLVATAMRDQVGQSVSVLAATVPADSTGIGDIDVHVSTTAPCSGQWLGCATPIIDGGQIVYAEVWVHPRMLDRSTASLDNVVRHEMGHAFGLAHYDDRYDGRVQTMHATSFDATEFRAGDLAGLRHVAVHASHVEPQPAPQPTPPPPPTTAPEPAPAPAPTPPAPSPPPAVDESGWRQVVEADGGVGRRGIQTL